MDNPTDPAEFHSKKLNGFTEALLAGSLKNLTHAYRFTTFPQIKMENVAEHSFWVSIYCLALWYKMAELCPPWFPKIVSKSALLEMALTHDLEERVSGDIVKSFKDYDKELNTLIDSVALNSSLKQFRAEKAPDGFVKASLLHREKRQIVDGQVQELVLEAEIVTLADIMSVGSKLLAEADLGNQVARSLLIQRFIPQMEALGEEYSGLAETISRNLSNSPEDDVRMWIAYFYKEMGDVVRWRVTGSVDDERYVGTWNND